MVAQHYVKLEKQLRNTFQEGLEQFEQAQISSQAEKGMVLVFNLFQCIRICSKHFEPLL